MQFFLPWSANPTGISLLAWRSEPNERGQRRLGPGTIHSEGHQLVSMHLTLLKGKRNKSNEKEFVALQPELINPPLQHLHFPFHLWDPMLLHRARPIPFQCLAI